MIHDTLAAPDLLGAFELTNPVPLKRTKLSNEQRNSLYVGCYSTLRDAAYDTYPNLIFTDCETILLRVAERLPHYRGSNSPDAFLKWAVRHVERDCRGYELIARVDRLYRTQVLSVISRNMYRSVAAGEDRSMQCEDLYADVLQYVFDHADEFLAAGTAKLSTRVCGLAKKHVWLYFNSPLLREIAKWRPAFEKMDEEQLNPLINEITPFDKRAYREQLM